MKVQLICHSTWRNWYVHLCTCNFITFYIKKIPSSACPTVPCEGARSRTRPAPTLMGVERVNVREARKPETPWFQVSACRLFHACFTIEKVTASLRCASLESELIRKSKSLKGAGSRPYGAVASGPGSRTGRPRGSPRDWRRRHGEARETDRPTRGAACRAHGEARGTGVGVHGEARETDRPTRGAACRAHGEARGTGAGVHGEARETDRPTRGELLAVPTGKPEGLASASTGKGIAGSRQTREVTTRHTKERNRWLQADP